MEEESDVVKMEEESAAVVEMEEEHEVLPKVKEKEEVKTTVQGTDNKKRKPEFKTVYCDVCNIPLNSSVQATAHYNGKSHQNKAKAQSPPEKVVPLPSTKLKPPAPQCLKCDLCKRTFNSNSQLQAHVTGKAHQLLAKSKIEASSGIVLPTNLQQPVVYGPVAPPNKTDGTDMTGQPVSVGSNVTNLFHCAKCNITLNSQKQMEQHNKGLRHKIVIGKAQPPQVTGTGEKWENVRYMKIANAVLGTNKDTITGSGGGMNLREFYCEKCDLTVNSQTQLDQHLESQKHQLRGTEINNIQNKRKRDFSDSTFQTGRNQYQHVPYKKPALPYQSRFNGTTSVNSVPPLSMNFVHGNKQFATDGYYTSDQLNFVKNYMPETFSQSWDHNFIY